MSPARKTRSSAKAAAATATQINNNERNSKKSTTRGRKSRKIIKPESESEDEFSQPPTSHPHEEIEEPEHEPQIEEEVKSPNVVSPLKISTIGINNAQGSLPVAPGTPGTPGNPGPNPVPQTPTPMPPPSNPAAFETDLPPELLHQGWRKFWSRRENRPYFFNRMSGETMWEMPPLHNNQPGQGGGGGTPGGGTPPHFHNPLNDPLGKIIF